MPILLNFSSWECADDGCLGTMVSLLIGLLYATLQLPLDNRENKNSRNVCLSQIRENIFPWKFLLIQYLLCWFHTKLYPTLRMDVSSHVFLAAPTRFNHAFFVVACICYHALTTVAAFQSCLILKYAVTSRLFLKWNKVETKSPVIRCYKLLINIQITRCRVFALFTSADNRSWKIRLKEYSVVLTTSFYGMNQRI